MNYFNVLDLAITLRSISASEMMYQFAERTGHGGAAPEEKVHESDVKHVQDLVELCKSNGMDDTATRVAISLSSLRGISRIPTSSALATELRNITEDVLLGLNQMTFLRVDGKLRSYVDNEKLFGERVHQAFPSARSDVKESGNCLASDCNTAAVFHLMCIAEHGLRALAVDRRIKLPKRGQPIELATWEDIIRELEKAEVAIQNYPKTLAREVQFEFYHGAMMQFRRFKNVFRNKIMHARNDFDFDSASAIAVFGHVKDFMQTLSARISETTRTPMIWRGKKWH